MGSRRRLNRTALGLVTSLVIVLFTVGVMAGVVGPNMFSGGGRKVTAVFQNTQQLLAGNEVRVDGVTEGSVTRVKRNPGGRSTTVVMSVPSSAGPLYRDATATIAWKTLLGGAFNVELTRGHPSAGPLGSSTIPISRTSNQVELDDITSVDNGGARSGLVHMLPELSKALSDPRPPTQVLGTLADVAPSLSTGLNALRGQVPDSDLRALVTGTASTMRALGASNDQLRGLIQGAATTVGVTAAREADIERALDAATPAMDQTKTTFAQLRRTFGLANPLLRSLQGPSAEVAPTFAQLYPTVVGARNLLRRAVPLLHALPPTLRSLASTSRTGLSLLDEIQPSLDRLQTTILPFLNTVDPGTGHTTAEMVGPTTEALGPDIAGQEDQNGHFIRFPATAGSSPFYLPCQTYLGNPAYHNKLLDCSSLQSILSAVLAYNPVPGLTGGLTAAGGRAGTTSAAQPKDGKRAGTGAAAAPGSSPAGGAGATATPSSSPPAGSSASAPSLMQSVLGSLGSLGQGLLGGKR